MPESAPKFEYNSVGCPVSLAVRYKSNPDSARYRSGTSAERRHIFLSPLYRHRKPVILSTSSQTALHSRLAVSRSRSPRKIVSKSWPHAVFCRSPLQRRDIILEARQHWYNNVPRIRLPQYVLQGFTRPAVVNQIQMRSTTHGHQKIAGNAGMGRSSVKLISTPL
jgi:hypothetical protein